MKPTETPLSQPTVHRDMTENPSKKQLTPDLEIKDAWFLAQTVIVTGRTYMARE